MEVVGLVEESVIQEAVIVDCNMVPAHIYGLRYDNAGGKYPSPVGDIGAGAK